MVVWSPGQCWNGRGNWSIWRKPPTFGIIPWIMLLVAITREIFMRIFISRFLYTFNFLFHFIMIGSIASALSKNFHKNVFARYLHTFYLSCHLIMVSPNASTFYGEREKKRNLHIGIFMKVLFFHKISKMWKFPDLQYLNLERSTNK